MIFECSGCQRLLWRPPVPPFEKQREIMAFCGPKGKDVKAIRVDRITERIEHRRLEALEEGVPALEKLAKRTKKRKTVRRK